MRKPYHHGDLRTALVEAGLRLLAERDVEGLALREVARTVGVSATAVYRHFPDKTALMAALAREGLDRLARAQHAASKSEDAGAACFAATGRAYVRFALTNPALFRLIFTSSAMLGATDETEAMRFLRANAAAASGTADPNRAETEALRAWGLVHGLSMLMLDGQLPADDGLIETLIPG